MTVIGSAYVNIRAITTQLEADIRKSLATIQDNITIKVNADTTAAVAEIERAVHTAANDANINVNADTGAASAGIAAVEEEAARSRPTLTVTLSDALARAKLAILTRTRSVVVAVKADSKPLGMMVSYIQRLSGARVATGNIKELVHEFTNIDKAVPGIAMAATKIGSIGGLATSAVGGVFTLVSSLGSLAQMVGVVLPGMLAGFAVGGITLMVALKDMSKQLPDVVAQFKGLKGVINGNFWDQARAPIRDMATTLFPALRDGIAGTSAALGRWTSEMAIGLKTSLGGGVLVTMFDNLSKSIDIAKNANQPFINGMVELGKVGSALLPDLANWWVTIANRFNTFITGAAADGTLTLWVKNGLTALHQLGRVLSDVGTIFGTITGAAQMAGSDGLGTLVKVLDNIRTAITSQDGIISLVTIFEGASKVANNLAAGVGSIMGALGSAAPAISSAFGSVSTVVSKLASAITVIISDPAFQAGFEKLFDGIAKGAGALLPVIGSTGPKLGALLSIIGDLAANIGGVLGAALQVALPFVTEFKKAIDPLIPVLGDALIKVIMSLGPVLQVFADRLKDLAPTIATVVTVGADLISKFLVAMAPALPGIVAGVLALVGAFKGMQAGITAMKGIRDTIDGLKNAKKTFDDVKAGVVALMESQKAQAVIQALVTGAQKAWQAATVVGTAIQWAFNAAMDANPIGVVVIAIAALVGGVILAYNKIGWFKDFVNGAFKLIQDIIGNLVSFWNTNIVPMFSGIGKVVQDAFGNIQKIIGGVIDWIGANWGLLLSILIGPLGLVVQYVVEHWGDITKNIGAVLDNIVSIWNTVWKGISDTFMAIWNGIVWFFEPLINLISAIIETTIGIVTAIWQAGWEIISTIFYGIWVNLVRFFTPILQGISDFITGVVTNVVAFWNAMWQAIGDFFVTIWNNMVAFYGPILQGIADFIGGVVNGIVAVWNAVWQAIGDFFVTIWNNMVAFYGPILQGIADFITGVVNNIVAVWNATWQGIFNFFSGIWNAIVGFVSPMIQAVANNISTVVNWISGVWNNTWSNISNFVSGVWNGIVNGVSGFVSNIQNFIGNVLNTIGNIGSDILGRIANFPSLLINAGRDLINGLAEGIRNSGDQIITMIKNIASNALGAIKDFFGIKSPSRVMRDQVGKMIGLGLAQGIEQSIGAVTKATDKLSVAATPIIAPVAFSATGSTSPVLSASQVFGGPTDPIGARMGASQGTTYPSGGAVIQVFPSQGMSEVQIGQTAARELGWQLINR